MICVDDGGETVADSKGKWFTTKPAIVGNACKASVKVSRTEVEYRGIDKKDIR